MSITDGLPPQVEEDFGRLKEAMTDSHFTPDHWSKLELMGSFGAPLGSIWELFGPPVFAPFPCAFFVSFYIPFSS